MKKIATILFVLISLCSQGQNSPEFWKVNFRHPTTQVYNGTLWKINATSNSLTVNDYTYSLSGGTSTPTTLWEEYGAWIQPLPATKKVRIPTLASMAGYGIPQGILPIYYDTQNKELVTYQLNGSVIVTDGAILSGCDQTYQVTAKASEVTLQIDSLANVCGCFTVKNMGAGSSVEITSLEGYDLGGTYTRTLAYGESVSLCPDAEKFTETTTTPQSIDDTTTYDATRAWVRANFDTINHTHTQDEIVGLSDSLGAKMSKNLPYGSTNDTSVYFDNGEYHLGVTEQKNQLLRYTAYTGVGGQNKVEVLANTGGITAAFSNGNTYTFTIPAGARIISMKINVSGLSTLKLVMGSGDMENSSATTRWMPIVQAWRLDQGSQLTGVTTSMNLTNFDTFQINGLINTTQCHVRVGF